MDLISVTEPEPPGATFFLQEPKPLLHGGSVSHFLSNKKLRVNLLLDSIYYSMLTNNNAHLYDIWNSGSRIFFVFGVHANLFYLFRNKYVCDDTVIILP